MPRLLPIITVGIYVEDYTIILCHRCRTRKNIGCHVWSAEPHVAHQMSGPCCPGLQPGWALQADADCRYEVGVAPLPDGKLRFLRLFCCPSGRTRIFQNFYSLVSVGAAHLKDGTQPQLFTITTYDANMAPVSSSLPGMLSLCITADVRWSKKGSKSIV